jgi:hypothetical protein
MWALPPVGRAFAIPADSPARTATLDRKGIQKLRDNWVCRLDA